MRRVLAIALAAPLILIGATDPRLAKDDQDAGYDEPRPASRPITYRPCRPGPGDDRCIQLYERGVRLAYADWLREHREEDEPVRLAMGGPDESIERPRHPRRNLHAGRRCHEEGGTAEDHRHARPQDDYGAEDELKDEAEEYGGEALGM